MTKTFKLFAVVTGMFFMMVSASCNSDDTNDSNSQCDDAICTLVFVTINVTVTDQEQNPVALDSFEVVNMVNGEDMTISLAPTQFEEARQTGMYPLITDGILEENQERQIQFKGFQNNQEVVNGNYTVATDCCHVDLISGDLQLTLQ